MPGTPDGALQWTLSPRVRRGETYLLLRTFSTRGPALQQGLNSSETGVHRRISAAILRIGIGYPAWMAADGPRSEEEEGLRERSEQALGDLAGALFDIPMFENALSAASGARGRALEAQRAAMEALNLPSAGDVERLERRLRTLSDRLEEVEEELDRLKS